MKRQEFDEIVRRLEAKYAGRPRALRLAVASLAALGYASFAAWFGLAIASGAFFFVPGLIIGGEGGAVLLVIGGLVAVCGVGGLARVLWVRLRPPEGYVLGRREAPALRALLDDLRRQLRCYRFHKVVITPVFNAGVNEAPQLGVLGWNRNYLQLGLPLLEALSVLELQSVLAHESAHLSARHGRFSNWIYRLRRSWQTAFAELSQPRSAGSLSLRPVVAKFIDWYWPRFNAHAFVLSRSNEFEADAVAARIAGADAAASALRRVELCDRFLNERFWPDLWQSAKEEPAPPGDVLERLGAALVRGVAEEDRTRWCAESLRTITNNSDTHPCLAERLRSLTAGAPLPRDPLSSLGAESSAAALLGEALPKARAALNARWQSGAANVWRERHHRAEALSHRLDDISRTHADGFSSPEILWDRVRATIDLEGDERAQPLLCEFLGRCPEHPVANFCRGRFLLSRGDAVGEMHVDRAVDIDEELVPKACEILHAYFVQTGRPDRLTELRVRMDRYEAAFSASKRERSSVSGSDTFLPHGLSETELEPVRAALAAEPQIIRAELARKELHYFTKQRMFVLCLRVVRPWHGLGNAPMERALAQRLAPKIKLPGRNLVIAPIGPFAAVARKIARVADAVLYEKPR